MQRQRLGRLFLVGRGLAQHVAHAHACSSRRLRNERPSYAESRISAWRKWKVPAAYGSRSTNSASRSHDSASRAASESPSSTRAISSLEKFAPRTDAQRRSARSPGARPSIRLVNTPSTLSGSSSKALLRTARGGDELLDEKRITARSLGNRRSKLLRRKPFRSCGDRQAPWASASGSGSGRRDMGRRHGRVFPGGGEAALIARSPRQNARRATVSSRRGCRDGAARV